MNFRPRPPAGLIDAIESSVGTKLPTDYKDFMMRHNGAEGPIGKDNYLDIWPLEELPALNEGYPVRRFAPGLILFGVDGGDTGYAFDTASEGLPVVEVPFIGEGREDVKTVARSFRSFLEELARE